MLQASLLVDNKDEWAHVGWGLIVYVSFAKGTSDEAVCTAAKKVLHAPLLTRGVWGDGGRPESAAKFCQDAATDDGGDGVEIEAVPQSGASGVSAQLAAADSGRSRASKPCPDILVIPQAALTNKYAGNRIQYRNQSTREEGKRLFDLFVDQLQDMTVTHPEHPALNKIRAQRKMHLFHERQAAKDRDLALAPEMLFREGSEHCGKYSDFDDQGLPTQLADGTPVSKSGRKRMAKMLAAHQKKHQQHIAAQNEAAESSTPSLLNSSPDAQEAPTTLKDKDMLLTEPIPRLPMCRVVAGTFGNRQALRFESEMGPFSHVFSF